MRYLIFILLLSFLLPSCMGRKSTSSAATPAQSTVPNYGYTIKRIFPHNPSSYTQGLVWDKGTMYEGTGQYGESMLMNVDISTGNKLQSTQLAPTFFGEGIALFNGKIYQLTWQESTLYIYDAKTLDKIREIKYNGEGWGLTNDSTMLYMSNGSDQITVRDPETFDILRTIDVRLNGNRVRGLNELEWIEGEIWANVYMTDVIVRIDPTSGNVTGTIDLEGILPASDRTPNTDVLNGIAYDEADKRIFVTGKNWSKLFEIEIFKR